MLNIAKMNYRGKGKWAAVAAALNEHGRILNTMRGEGGVSVEQAGRDLVFRGHRPRSGGELVKIFLPQQTDVAEVGTFDGYVFLRGDRERTIGNVLTPNMVNSTVALPFKKFDVSSFDDGDFYLYVRANIRGPVVSGGIYCEAVHPVDRDDWDPNTHAYLLLATGEIADGLITTFTRRYNGGDWYLHGL